MSNRKQDEELRQLRRGNFAAYKMYSQRITNIMKETEKNIDDLFTCPITLDKIDIPAVLPSGNTVDSKVMENLIRGGGRDGGKDPFDRTKKFKVVTRNFFATVNYLLVWSIGTTSTKDSRNTP